ncbi:uncharacterized protein K441DRAFT_670177 [Cenococcum geophilum 1.58]|uniref:Uncharacterized protein n=1 Tax=Cenococcum geophilum 1.58 TaxID=794803 RepID=A0ACC8EN80_9PEZI|nr:hypothetical protein K441DRAFT_670177 [Cenococcum geophilum 1.58]
MTSPASPTTEPPVFELGTTLEIPPAAGLEQNQELPFSIANFKKAVTDRLRAPDGDDAQLWIVFSDFDCSKLKYIDRLRYPIRLQLDDSKLIVKMVGLVQEMMHNILMALIQEEMGRIGLRPGRNYLILGSARYQHRSNNSFKEADSTIAPICLQPWPALVIEAGWAETLARLHIDAQWWLSAQVPPNNTTLVILLSFTKSQRTFRLEKYELVTTPNRVVTRSAPLGVRNLAMCTQVTTIDIRSTPPIITGAPFVLPFAGIMRRPPIAPERNISIDAVDLEVWAMAIARAWNL